MPPAPAGPNTYAGQETNWTSEPRFDKLALNIDNNSDFFRIYDVGGTQPFMRVDSAGRMILYEGATTQFTLQYDAATQNTFAVQRYEEVIGGTPNYRWSTGAFSGSGGTSRQINSWYVWQESTTTGTLIQEYRIVAEDRGSVRIQGFSANSGVRNVFNGELRLGERENFQGRISYEGASGADLYIENTFVSNNADIIFRTQTNNVGATQIPLTLKGRGEAIFKDEIQTISGNNLILRPATGFIDIDSQVLIAPTGASLGRSTDSVGTHGKSALQSTLSNLTGGASAPLSLAAVSGIGGGNDAIINDNFTKLFNVLQALGPIV